MSQQVVGPLQQRLATVRRAAKIARQATEILCAEKRALFARSQYLIALSDELVDRVHRQTLAQRSKK
jgi:hypothetical protein